MWPCYTAAPVPVVFEPVPSERLSHRTTVQSNTGRNIELEATTTVMPA
ncbi:hypothetical protein CMUS01_14417 [Colletotrichum musicola]|uniref:Uncharacterized protein n=1 Tax=Colletotrichum musicola TaxID=2175873 RepID=A0A8H6J495_9PEZI|nr:hypothetical protein CMUS01_14417 [Colletotrichum musicola]